MKKNLMTLTSSSEIFVGLDCETTGRDVSSGARLFNAALALKVDNKFLMREVNLKPDSYTWDEEAQAVHGISKSIVESYPSSTVAEKILSDFLENSITSTSRQLIAVGFNVGSFDLPFFRESFPSLMLGFSHRVVDLNSLIFFFSSYLSENKSFDSLKGELKEKASEVISSMDANIRPHQAGYDSLEALLILDLLRTQFKGSTKN